MIARKCAYSRLCSLAMFLIGGNFAGTAEADVKLPAIFADHMVLQRDLPIPIWGWADPGERVTIRAASAQATTTARADGKWEVKFDPLTCSAEPIEVVITAKNTIRLTDVLVGDVWICAGQSNMGFSLNGASNAAAEMPKARYPRIRLFMVETKMAFEPQVDCAGKWSACTPGSAQNFSAVGYFFGRDLYVKLGIPIGLVETSLGGTSAEAWTSLQGLRANPATWPVADAFDKTKAILIERMAKYETETVPRWRQEDALWRKEVNPAYQETLRRWNEEVRQAKAAGRPEPVRPQPSRPHPILPPLPNRHAATLLSNGMLAPLVPFGIKGVIWYQGEANTDNPLAYRQIFPTMIRDWRTRWRQGDFPFLFVQLANANARADHPTESLWAGVREAQSMALSLPATGQAVTIDVGEVDVHAHDKLDVGRRLALLARHVAYGEELVCSGPTFQRMQVEGDKVRVTFTDTNSGLSAGDRRMSTGLKGFALAGADRKFVWSSARIDGQSVLVWSDRVPHPVAVRYGWADNPEVNLYNRENLPAAPFRTDDWPLSPAKR